MKTVWVIEDGAYSDYHVVGVYSTKENCETTLAEINKDRKSDLAMMDEWPLDPAVEQRNAGLQQWKVTMLKDGSVESVENYGTAYLLADQEARVIERSQWFHMPKDMGYPKPDCIDPIVWARDKEHAIKIVNERRIGMLDAGIWK